MDSKSRVWAALRREPADRIPVWMWFHPETVSHLAAMLEVPADRVPDAFGDDIRQAWVGNNHAMEGIVHHRDGEGHVDLWGIEWVREGPFNQIKRSPLADSGDTEIRRYAYPYAGVDELLAPMEFLMGSDNERFVGCDISPCLFEMVCRLRGMNGALLDLAANPGRSQLMLRQAGEFSCYLAGEACDRFELDWLWTGDDVGGQDSMMMSPECWREMIRPQLETIVRVGKSRGLPVAYHSCGSIRPIISDLVAMGLDVLNPIQCNCPGMDPLELKSEFGGNLCFMGGVDTQQLLPYGTADEVRRETERLIEGMTSDGGGYILGASHAVPPETPVANIFAMYEAAGVRRGEIFDRAAEIRTQDER